MQVDEIVNRVRSAIDEQMANDSEFLGQSSDEQNLTDVITDKIPYALTYVIENAPEDKLDGSILSGLTDEEMSGVSVSAGNPVKVRIPTDVIRIVSARLSSWSLSPIPVTEHSQAYLMQQDEYARGSWDRPVSAIVHGFLELYSARSNSDEVQVSVVRRQAVSGTGSVVTVPVRLEAAFIYQVAGLAMVAFREQVAESLFAIAREHLIGINQE